MSKNQVILTLSRKQVVLLLWLVESVIDFVDSMEKMDFNFNIQELRDFRDFVYLNFDLKY